MRICIVTVAKLLRLGGMQDHTDDLSACLVRCGHEVDVITGRRPDGVEASSEMALRGTSSMWLRSSVRAGFAIRGGLGVSADAFVHLDGKWRYDIVHSESTSALGLVRRRVHDGPVVAKFHGNFLGLARAALQRANRERTPGLRSARPRCSAC